MTYKAAITSAMTALSTDPRTRFVGYGMKRGRSMGTLSGVPEEQIIETTLAENQMTGFATGLSIMGRLPLVYFERADFLMHACDAIVNHLDKLSEISLGQFRPAVILRVTVGNTTKPLFTGITHTRDHAHAFRAMVSFPVVVLMRTADILPRYAHARKRQLEGVSTMMIEYKDLL